MVLACDAFKGSLTSLDVADAVRRGVLDRVPGARVEAVAVADGGEGTVAAALAAGWRGVPVEVHGPTGEPVTATLAVRHGDPTTVTVLVELADACGLGRLPGGVPAPLTASSRGLGEAILAALDLGADEVVVGVGGSAGTDGGGGLLAALGARLLDAEGHDLPDGGAALADLASLDLSALDPRALRIRLVLAADVDSPLLGAQGAAAVFGPQKGATPAEVRQLEEALAHWSAVVPVPESTNRSRQVRAPVPESTNRSSWVRMPGAGAAGGVGFALLAVLGAQRRSGVDVVLDLVGLDGRLAASSAGNTSAGEDGGADPPALVVTGEGALDEQTLAGKAVTGVARRAQAHGIPVVAVCGRLALTPAELRTLGVERAYPLSDLEPNPERSIRDARELLRRIGARLADDWLVGDAAAGRVSDAPG